MGREENLLSTAKDRAAPLSACVRLSSGRFPGGQVLLGTEGLPLG